jgi:hypothetical protein
MSKQLLQSSVAINRVLVAAELSLTCSDLYAEVKESNYSIAEAIANTTGVNEYIGSLCRRLHKIYCDYNISTTEMEPETNKTGMGQVQTSDIEAILKEGNLRERMTLLINIARGEKKFLWKLVQETNTPKSKHPDLNHAVLQGRIHRAYLMTGVCDIDEIVDFAKETISDVTVKEMPNRMLDFLHDGPVLLSRFCSWSGNDLLRSERPISERANHFIPINRIYPPLSIREVGYIQKHNPEWDEYQHIPWENGLMVWIINPDNLYSRLAKRLKQETISGPSSTTDGILQLAELFTDFDVELTVLACAAFLCGAHHHSAWEVLLAAIPFGLPYTSDVDAYAYIHQTLMSRQKTKKHGE